VEVLVSYSLKKQQRSKKPQQRGVEDSWGDLPIGKKTGARGFLSAGHQANQHFL
jgi:hypothetical protein